MPPPLPRSRTVSPGFSSASAVGLPHPSEARTAASGNWFFSPALYRFEVIGSVEQHDEAGPQQAAPLPEATRRACWPYFSLTTSLIDIIYPLALDLNDRIRTEYLVSGAALGIEEREQLFQSCRVR